MLRRKCDLIQIQTAKLRKNLTGKEKKLKCIARFEPLHSILHTRAQTLGHPANHSQPSPSHLYSPRTDKPYQPFATHPLTSQPLPSIPSSNRDVVRTGVSRSGRDCICIVTCIIIPLPTFECTFCVQQKY